MKNNVTPRPVLELKAKGRSPEIRNQIAAASPTENRRFQVANRPAYSPAAGGIVGARVNLPWRYEHL
jgi:hypothetical protein